VVLDHTAALGGAELALARLLDAVDPTRAEVRTVLFADGPLRGRLEAAGHEVHVLPLDPNLAATERHDVGVARSARRVLQLLPFVWRLGRLVRSLGVDVVHTTSLKADILGTPAAWLARRPVVWHVHDRISADYLPRPVVAALRAVARRVPRHVVVNSAATAATLPGVRRMTVAYPGVAPSQIGPDPAARARPARATVGIIGRISPTKGQREFVRAAAQVLATHPGTDFRVVGAALFAERPYEDEVRAEVRRLGIADRVTFTGFVGDPAAELDALTVCVHASGTPEPFGQVIVEAMVRGVPVVATRGGGATEIVEPAGDGPYGVLVPPHDPTALARAIVGVLDAPGIARERARAAWAAAQERFGVARTAEAVTEVWRQAAAG
jgi:glycosyltransferase involved in cell wall biosynthesis